MEITEEQLIAIASTVLRTWNGNAGYEGAYWRARRGQAILAALRPVIEGVAGEVAEEARFGAIDWVS